MYFHEFVYSYPIFIRSLTPSLPFHCLMPYTGTNFLCFSFFPSANVSSPPPHPAPKLVLKFFFVSCPVTCGAVGSKLHFKIIFMSCSQQASSRPQVHFFVPLCEKLIGSWWQAGHWYLALTGSPAGGAQSHGGGSVAKPAQGGGPDVARLCSIEIQTKPQIRDHFLETPQLETGTHPESHNSWSPHARIYVSCRKRYLCVIDWFL